MEKNKNYWNKELPYLDGIEFYHVLPFSPEMASAILANRVDLALSQCVLSSAVQLWSDLLFRSYETSSPGGEL